MSQTWKLVGPAGKPYASAVPGTLGGHCRNHIYGRLDCPAALRAIARGGYRNYGLESPRLLKRGMKSRSLFGAWGMGRPGGLAHFSVIGGVVAQDIVGWSHC